MKTPRAIVRRVLALAGVAAVATGVAVAIPGTAQAHHPIVTGSAECDPTSGTWRVTWTVENSESDITGTLTEVTLTPSGSTVSAIAPGATLPVSGQPPLTGLQVLPGSATSAALEVTALWQRPKYTVTRSASASVELRGTCQIPAQAKPGATFASHCDGSVTVTLINGADATKAAAFSVTGTAGFSSTTSVAPNDSGTVDVPAANSAAITVTAGGRTVATGGFQEPKECAAPQTTVTKACDSLTVSVSNPDGGRLVTASLKPSTADATTFTLAPGAEKSVSFAAAPGLTVAMQVTGLDDQTVEWARQAACEPDLPQTGTNLTAAIATGVGLVVVGTAILFVVRRRRGAHARF